MCKGVLMTAVGISLREENQDLLIASKILILRVLSVGASLLSETENVCHRRSSYRTLPSKH